MISLVFHRNYIVMGDVGRQHRFRVALEYDESHVVENI